jgi:hypothetical protein
MGKIRNGRPLPRRIGNREEYRRDSLYPSNNKEFELLSNVLQPPKEFQSSFEENKTKHM